MNVDAPEARQRKNLVRQDQPVGDHHQDVRMPGSEFGTRGFGSELSRLRHRQLLREGGGFHRARRQVPATPARAVRLRQNPDHRVVRVQCRQSWQGEFRRARKGDAQRYHPFGLADVRPGR